MLISRNLYSIFYDAEQGTGAGNGAEPAPEVVTPAPNIDEKAVDDHLNDDPLNFGDEDIDDMTNDSPIVSNPPVADPAKKEPAKQPEEKVVPEPAPELDEEGNPIVKPAADDKTTDPEGETSIIKLGEIEYEPEQLSKIIKEHGDMSAWEKNLRALSHLKDMNPETAAALVPFVLSQKEIPKGLVEEPIVTSVLEGLKDFELELPYTDEEGNEQVLKVDLEKIKPAILKAVDLTTAAHKPTLDKAKATEISVQRGRMDEMLVNFTKDKETQFAFHKGKDKSLIDHIDDVLETPGHPDSDAVKLLKAVVDMIDGDQIKTMDDAYQFLYQEKQAKKATDILNSVVNNQKQGKAETRGQEPKKDASEMPDIDDSAEDILENIIPK